MRNCPKYGKGRTREDQMVRARLLEEVEYHPFRGLPEVYRDLSRRRGTEVFADRQGDYHTSKGTIRLPHDMELPLAQIRYIAVRGYKKNAKR